MRKVSFFCNLLGLLGIYLFASGALNLALKGETYGRRLVETCHQPFVDITPLAGSVFVGAVFLVLVAALVIPSSRSHDGAGRLNLSWPAVVGVAFWVNALVVAGITGFIFVGSHSVSDPASVGGIYAAAAVEACIGLVLAIAMLFLHRPRWVFLPALGILMAGVTALGTILWLGKHGPLHLPWE